ncbi:MAG: ABC transporter substrate-binding protein [Clostridia bacterium]|nr:ABC transporter substrate-binding protein [[Bacteroides] pectinophilus]MDD5874236.1 ABC transporter substrate-binding protein [Clostridia bacterium]
MRLGKMIKKAACMMLAAVMATGMAACGNSSEKSSGKIKVGVIQLIENGAFNDMKDGFIEELRAKGYTEDKCDIVVKSAQGDTATLNTICQEMVDSKMDLVATIATPATQAMVNMDSDIPVVFISVSAPVAAGVTSSMEKPDKNATGTSNAIPVSDIFNLSDSLTPGNKTYGLIYNTGEVNSVNTVKDAKSYLDGKGLKYVEAVVTNSSEIQQAAESLVGSVDAIFVPNDSVVQSGMAQITEITRKNKIPVYACSATTVQSGAFATVAMNDKQIGSQSADMAVEILGGKKVADVPSVVVPASGTVINQNTMEALGVTIPDSVKSTAQLITDAK